jgi:hypothetical protein
MRRTEAAASSRPRPCLTPAQQLRTWIGSAGTFISFPADGPSAPFLVADLGPEVDPFILHLFAALAEKERAMISARTKTALSAARKRGIALGDPKIAQARKRAVRSIKSIADQHPSNILPIIREIQRAG